jgi:hypothetical protein
MRYVMFMIPAVYASQDPDEAPSPEMIQAMMKYNADLADAGVLESVNGLHPPTVGVQVTFGADGSTVSHIASEGSVGGYWIIDVSSHEAAVEWARRCPALPGDVLELRRIEEMDDLPAEVQDLVSGVDQ